MENMPRGVLRDFYSGAPATERIPALIDRIPRWSVESLRQELSLTLPKDIASRNIVLLEELAKTQIQ
jgi:hypothetical protein